MDEVPAIDFLLDPEVSLPIFHEVNVAVDCLVDSCLAPEGASNPESVVVACSPTASMEVQVVSPLFHDDDAMRVLAEPPAGLVQDDPVTLEISEVDAVTAVSIEVVVV